MPIKAANPRNRGGAAGPKPYPRTVAKKLNLEVDLDPQITEDEAGGHESTDKDLLENRPPHHDAS